MDFAFIMLWLAVGICIYWCPVPWRIPRIPIPPGPWPPGPDPGPRPGWTAVLSGLGGVAGGWLFANAWGPEQGIVTASYAAITCIGAVAGSILALGVTTAFLQGQGRPATE